MKLSTFPLFVPKNSLKFCCIKSNPSFMSCIILCCTNIYTNAILLNKSSCREYCHSFNLVIFRLLKIVSSLENIHSHSSLSIIDLVGKVSAPRVAMGLKKQILAEKGLNIICKTFTLSFYSLSFSQVSD